MKSWYFFLWSIFHKISHYRACFKTFFGEFFNFFLSLVGFAYVGGFFLWYFWFWILHRLKWTFRASKQETMTTRKKVLEWIQNKRQIKQSLTVRWDFSLVFYYFCRDLCRKDLKFKTGECGETWGIYIKDLEWKGVKWSRWRFEWNITTAFFSCCWH